MKGVFPKIVSAAAALMAAFVSMRGVCQEADSARLASVRQTLDSLVSRDAAYASEVDVSVGRMQLSELLRNVARAAEVNLSARGLEELSVSCNFSRARLDDLLFFLCREHGLDLSAVGNIVSVYPAAPVAPLPAVPRIDYSQETGRMSYDLSGDRLIGVVRRVAALTGVNIVIPRSLYAFSVSGFVDGMPLDEALATLASVNGLVSEKDEGGVWRFYEDTTAGAAAGASFRPETRFSENELSVDSLGLITARISRGNLSDIVSDLCRRLGLNYFFIVPPQGQTAVYVKDVDFDTLLSVMLSGTRSTYYRENGIYIFGEASREGGVAAVEVVSMRYRSIDGVDELLPPSIADGLHIKSFPDLNSLVVSGDRRRVGRVVSFLRGIDRSVPLVTIEIIIVESTKSAVREAGLGLGLGATPAVTGGTLSPGIDLTFSAQSVNSLINSFNGFGAVNLGRVTPNFYLSLKALEESGDIELRSTPKLSTLNGHEATLKSGETRYYKEVVNNIIGTQNPMQSESYTWKSVEANLTVRIVPHVSSDDHITLDIEIEQSEFTGREEKDSPPGTATRSFKSLIKVGNEDIVLLGGIDRNSREKSGSGLPWISRIPVLKWLFGTTKDNKSDHRLNVFIKPTVTH